VSEQNSGHQGPLSDFWTPTKNLLNVIRPAIWAPFFIIALIAALFIPSQTHDLIRTLSDAPLSREALAEPGAAATLLNAIADATVRFGPTSAGVAGLGLAMWLAMRVSFVRRYPYTPEVQKPWHRWLRKWTPRFGALLPSVTFALAFFAFGSTQLAAVQLVIGVILFVLLVFRRPIIRIIPVLGGVAPVRRELENSTDLAATSEIKEVELTLALFAGLFLVPAFAWMALSPVAAPQHMGTIGVATVLMSFFIVIVSLFYALIAEPVLTGLRRLTGDPDVLFPALTVTVLAILVLNARSMRYEVPTLPPAADVAAFNAPYLLADGATPDAETFADQWLEARLGEGDGPYTAYVVAAEGGGLRAAYWTAAVLGRWQDHDPCFASRVFVVSGVSGGAVGAASFAAGLRAAETGALGPRTEACAGQPATALPAMPGGAGAPERIGPLQSLAEAHLGQDHLAPVIAGLSWNVIGSVWIWATDRIAPQRFDRGHYLESSWAEAWRRALADQAGYADLDADRRAALEGLFSLDGDFLDLWRPLGDPQAAPDVASPRTPPALIFPTTSVRTGEAWSVSPVRITEAVDRCEPPDVYDVLGDRRLSTPAAAHMSARFTYISPAGRLRFDAERCAEVGHEVEDDRFVDGGYFEGSGADRALDAAQALARAAAARGVDLTIVPIIINTDPGAPAEDAGTFLVDLVAPPAALLQARNARGRHAVAELTAFTQGRLNNPAAPIVCTLPATEDGEGPNGKAAAASTGYDSAGEPVPLGWVLSGWMRERITTAAAEQLRTGQPPCALDIETLRREMK
jgi:hypothetical protein